MPYLTVTLRDCYVCGAPIALTENLHRKFQETGEGFYCPNGHSISYKGTIKKLEQRIADLEQQKRQILEQNGQLERKLKRVEVGCCPHCNRHFTNLARHIKTKHGK